MHTHHRHPGSRARSVKCWMCSARRGAMRTLFLVARLPNALRRTKTVRKASRASSYRERPKYANHIKSIRYFGPKLPKGKWDSYARRRFHAIQDSSGMSRYPEEALGLSGGYWDFRGDNRL